VIELEGEEQFGEATAEDELVVQERGPELLPDLRPDGRVFYRRKIFQQPRSICCAAERMPEVVPARITKRKHLFTGG